MVRSTNHIEPIVSAMATKSKYRKWTREETIIVFYLYCQIPFSKSKKSHPEVRRFAKLVDRTPSSVNMKIGNFGSFDPELRRQGITGLQNASRLDKEIWNEFHDNWRALIDESQRLIAEREAEIGSEPDAIAPDIVAHTQMHGKERMAVRKIRENQPFFRKAILSAYESTCCITGIDIETLLIASHIKPWAESDSTEQLNPRNGLCLNALHDRAFDRGLIAVEDDYSVIVSKRVSHSRNDAVRSLLLGYEGRQIKLPTRFIPGSDFIEWHRNNIFVG